MIATSTASTASTAPEFSTKKPLTFSPFVPEAGQYTMELYAYKNTNSIECIIGGEIHQTYKTTFNTGHAILLSVRPGYKAKDIRSQIQRSYPECKNTVFVFRHFSDKAGWDIWRVVPEDVEFMEITDLYNVVVYDKNAPSPTRLNHISYFAFGRLKELGFMVPFDYDTGRIDTCLFPLTQVDVFLKTKGTNLEEFLSKYRA